MNTCDFGTLDRGRGVRKVDLCELCRSTDNIVNNHWNCNNLTSRRARFNMWLYISEMRRERALKIEIEK